MPQINKKYLNSFFRDLWFNNTEQSKNPSWNIVNIVEIFPCSRNCSFIALWRHRCEFYWLWRLIVFYVICVRTDIKENWKRKLRQEGRKLCSLGGLKQAHKHRVLQVNFIFFTVNSKWRYEIVSLIKYYSIHLIKGVILTQFLLGSVFRSFSEYTCI